MRMVRTLVTVGTADVQPPMAVRGDRAWRPWRHRAGATYEANTEAVDHGVFGFADRSRIDHTH